MVSLLARALPGVRLFGAGGDDMGAAGVEVRHHASGLAVTGLSDLRRHVDQLAVTLPFEEPWFRQRGVNATFVGHRRGSRRWRWS